MPTTDDDKTDGAENPVNGFAQDTPHGSWLNKLPTAQQRISTMPDGNDDSTAAANPTRPKRQRRVRDWTTHQECSPSWLYALHGPDGWYSAVVTKEPVPGAFTLVIQSIDRNRLPLFQDAFSWSCGCLTDGDTWFHSLDGMLSQILYYATGTADDWTMTQYPVPTDRWIDLCTDGELHGQGGMLCLHHSPR